MTGALAQLVSLTEAGRVFDEVSVQLYDALNKGVIAAVNSSGK